MEGERKIKRAKEREKTMGDWREVPQSPLVFFPLFRSLYFTKKRKVVKEGADKEFDCQTSCYIMLIFYVYPSVILQAIF